jgi:uncharacterized protein
MPSSPLYVLKSGETMPVKPTANEEEYFARQEAERRRKIADEQQARLKTEERERDRTLHFMRCPKCGLLLEEITFGDVRVDKCFGCEGIWLDKGEFETL